MSVLFRRACRTLIALAPAVGPALAFRASAPVAAARLAGPTPKTWYVQASGRHTQRGPCANSSTITGEARAGTFSTVVQSPFAGGTFQISYTPSSVSLVPSGFSTTPTPTASPTPVASPTESQFHVFLPFVSNR